MQGPQKNRITAEIYGQSYTIAGTEATGHMRLVAALVDEKMREIAMASPHLDMAKLAVLTAVNATHDMLMVSARLEAAEALLKQDGAED